MKFCIIYCSLALPRYQVREQQESTTSNPVVTRPNEPHGSKKEVKKYFKPFLYSKDSQPCQCSACVGAMATIITTVSLFIMLHKNNCVSLIDI